ncbi:MAG TPA: hypothetical protein VN938_16700 [Xanthobacteraceae bacterium]|jgi:hypothetical protein|nr:hypothetical protein [Xanthobacteraceae bacterium]
MSVDPSLPNPPLRRSARSSSAGRPNRWLLRLVAIPVLAGAGLLIYRGLQERFVLPDCDSNRAKETLTSVLKGLDSAPLRYEPINTVSRNDKEVVCNAALPLSDGATLNVDYRFFWQGSSAQMRYSISRSEPKASNNNAPAAPLR